MDSSLALASSHRATLTYRCKNNLQHLFLTFHVNAYSDMSGYPCNGSYEDEDALFIEIEAPSTQAS